LRERALDAGSGRMRLEFFNVFELAARVLLEENPLATSSEGARTANRLVIVGVGHLGESLLINAARQRRTNGSTAKLHATLIDRNAHRIAESLLVRYPGLKKNCELTPLEMDVHSGEFQAGEFLAGPGGGSRVFVCLDEDSQSLSAALALVRHGREQDSAIVVRMAQDAGLAMLLREVESTSGSFKHLRAFGLLDRTCHPDQVLRGTHELLARAIHENYLRQQRAAGVAPEQNSSLCPWDALPEHLKEANRQQADDIGAKLKAVHCSAAPLLDWEEPLFKFEPDEVERLARMEHERWMTAKLDGGWRHGSKKDDEARTHPCLIPYDDLPPHEKEKDRSAVREIPATLAEAGFRVHRLKPNATK